MRARIVLLNANGDGKNGIMAATGTAKTTVWRWQARLMEEGVEGLLRDKTRPPAQAVVLSLDEKSQIQALDRPRPGLPLEKGRGPTMTHDYKRHGTTTLFAVLNILDGTVTGRNMQRCRHQEFIRFLNALERDIPAGKVVHVILDNYDAHRHARSAPGLNVTRAGPSTSPRHRIHLILPVPP